MAEDRVHQHKEFTQLKTTLKVEGSKYVGE